MKSIFVSSTFRDMNFERDVLNRRIAPKINHQLQQYNQSVRILDLRWGVDTSELEEQEATDRVLSVCLDAIDKCKPYFVVLIGDRYGYVPAGHGLSVTHMEILRGALECTDRDHIYIYLRDADYTEMPEEVKDTYIEQDRDARACLQQLTDTLQQEMPQCCRRYTARWDDQQKCLVSEDFEQIILADLQRDLVEENRGICYRSDLHRQLSENEQILAENVRFAYSDQTRISADVQQIIQADRPWALIGAAGAGKSVYMSMLCSGLRRAGRKAHILFCGDNAFSSSVRNAAEMVLYALLDAAGMEYDYETFAALSYTDLISRIVEVRGYVKEKCCLLLDAVDKCDQGMMRFVFWCGSFLSEQLQLAVSSRMTQEIQGRSASLHLVQMEYARIDYQHMAGCILEKNGKQLHSDCIGLAVEKVQTPLQLQLLLLRLLRLSGKDFDAIQRSGGGMEQINAYLKTVIAESPEETGELIAQYLQELLDDGEKPQFYLCMLNLLAFCEYGLQETDIQALYERMETKWTELEYLDFLERYAFFIRVRENGRLDVSHDIIRQTLRDVLERNRVPVCALMAEYLLHHPRQEKQTVRAFLDAAFLGGQQKLMMEFVRKYSDGWTSVTQQALTEEIQRSVRRMFFQDGGDFLFSVVSQCRSADDLFYLQLAISTSLRTVEDCHEEDVLVRIAYVVMSIPLQIEAFRETKIGNESLLDVELKDCVGFLRMNNVREERIQKFLSDCRNKMGKPEEELRPEGPEAEAEEILEQLHRVPTHEKVYFWGKLAKLARRISQEEEYAPLAGRLLHTLLEIEGEALVDVEEADRQRMRAEVYTSLQKVCKTLGQWEKGIAYEQRSLEIYEAIYAKNPSEEFFQKYRDRKYNIANITEAWAISEETNAQLWEKTKVAYQEVYDLELQAMAYGLSMQRVRHTASVICSLGTALINTGFHDEGMEKYREGIALILDSLRNHPSNELYLEVCLQLMECANQLAICRKIDEACDLSEEASGYISLIVRSGDAQAIGKIQEDCVLFCRSIDRLLQRSDEEQNVEDQMNICLLMATVYLAALPGNDHRVKVGLLMAMSNISAIFFWALQDYAQAYESYDRLLQMTLQYDLAEADADGEFNDEVNDRLIDAYVRCLLCLERMGRREELKELIADGVQWAGYIADHLDYLQSDVAGVLVTMSQRLLRNDSSLGVGFLVMAYSVAMAEDYDKEKYADTFAFILRAMQELENRDESGIPE